MKPKAKKDQKRRAIGTHGTGTTDVAWDGALNAANARSDEDRAYYARIYAWEEPEGETGAKSTYKFPHHMVSADGNPGDANIRGLNAIIAVLNGARGGTTIPDADRQGVWNHAAKHLRDAGREPAALRGDRTQKDQRRTFKVSELRIDQAEGESPKIRGHAAIFDSLSVPIMGFREIVKPGAFAKTISESDIRALWNHDENFVLGRSKNKTLELREDDKGLAVTIDPPDAQWARDFMESIKRGDVDQMSFGFNTIKDHWYEVEGEMRRDLIEVRLFDVSPVTFPAYEATDVAVRNAAKELGLDADAFAAAICSARAGKLGDADLTVLRSAQQAITALLPTEPPEPEHSEENEPPENGHSDMDLRRRRLDLLDAENT